MLLVFDSLIPGFLFVIILVDGLDYPAFHKEGLSPHVVDDSYEIIQTQINADPVKKNSKPKTNHIKGLIRTHRR